MTTFRVHFEDGSKVEIQAETPVAAQAAAQKNRPASGVVTKVKRVRS